MRKVTSIYTALLAAAIFCLTTTAVAEDTGRVTFEHNGEITVGDTSYTGTGQFKFAIVNIFGGQTLWSNDLTSSGGGEPSSSIPLPVQNGSYEVEIGDPTTGMATLDPDVLDSQLPLRLRVWLNTGSGFERQIPDKKLLNQKSEPLKLGDTDFTIFVNASTGDDDSSGLSQFEPKKTIQSAIKIVPARVNCNVLVDIADGTYPEQVTIHGIHVIPGKSLVLLGDEVWNHTAGVPAVIIDAAGYENAILGVHSSGIAIRGIAVQNASATGIHMEHADFEIEKVLVRDNNFNGITATFGTILSLKSSRMNNNAIHGVSVGGYSTAEITSCISTNNLGGGLAVFNSNVGLYVTNTFSNNAFNGVLAWGNAQIGCGSSYSGTVSNNGAYGIAAVNDAYFSNFVGPNTITGNASGATFEVNGGDVDY